jgi:NADH-quinone oxidoreductase subunit L
MTAFYMFRLLFLTFFGNFRGTEKQKSHLHESPLVITIPLMALAALSAIGGFIGVPEVLGGSNFLGHYLSPVLFGISPAHASGLDHEAIMNTEKVLMGISTGAVIVTIAISWLVYVKNASIPAKDEEAVSTPHKILYNKYFIDEIYNTLFVKTLQWLSDKFYSILEIKGIDNFVNGIGKGLTRGSATLKYIQNGSISIYLLAMVIGIILILFVNSII